MPKSDESESATLLIGTEGEWTGRALESVLADRGYGVIRTRSGADALRFARRSKPDAIILDQDIGGISGTDVCRMLRDDPTFDPATPVILIGTLPPTRAERSAAFSAGAWSFVTPPIDTEILVDELSTFVRARRAAKASREADPLRDPTEGLLSPTELERWAEKLAAHAARKGEPLSCVVLTAVINAATSSSRIDAHSMAAAFIESSRAHMRQSDVIGRTTDGRLALLAPDTDAAGVLGFLERLRSAIDGASSALSRRVRGDAGFYAGYCVVNDFATSSFEASELIRRATRAVEHVQLSPGGEKALSFDQVPLN